jgi:hypothetical protein
MNLSPTIQERAYQLTSEYPTIAEIRRQLMKERYESVDAHLGARSFRLTLKRMCRSSVKAPVLRGVPLTGEILALQTDDERLCLSVRIPDVSSSNQF